MPPNPPSSSPSSEDTSSQEIKSDTQTNVKSSKEEGETSSAPKNPLFVRIWTKEGELAILTAMSAYKLKTGLDPSANTRAFYEFAHKDIPIEMTRSQVVNKMRRLKDRYRNNVVKVKGGTVLDETHDIKCFEISKKVWHEDETVDSGAKSEKRKAKSAVDSVEEASNKKAKKDKLSVEEASNKKQHMGGEDQVGFWDKYPRLKETLEVENNGSFLKDGKKAMEFDVSKIGDAKAKELEDKWKGYQAKEAELKLFKLELVTQQTKVVFDQLMKL